MGCTGQASRTQLSNASQTTSEATRHIYATFRGKHQRQFETGVPQGGALSPILFNMYTPDTPTPQAQVKLVTYMDDITITSTHNDITKADMQSYLREIHAWTQTDNLNLRPDKTACTLFAPGPAECGTQITLQMHSITLLVNIVPELLWLTLDPRLTYNKHMEIRTTDARRTIIIIIIYI